MAFLVGLGTFIAALVAGGILVGLGHGFIGFMVMLAAIPGAIVAWMKWNSSTTSVSSPARRRRIAAFGSLTIGAPWSRQRIEKSSSSSRSVLLAGLGGVLVVLGGTK